MKILFGKYKGKELCEVPRNYLCWLYHQPDLNGPLKQAIEKRLGKEPSPCELQRRRQEVIDRINELDWLRLDDVREFLSR